MTDLEITRMCAEAMGFRVVGETTPPTGGVWAMQEGAGKQYNPLHDDAQAMALVKKLELMLTKDISPSEWRAERDSDSPIGRSPDLNRAICECVAKMQQRR